MKRRTFLQQTGGVLAATAISEMALTLLGDRYQRALAKPGNRKLALLIGINAYPAKALEATATADLTLKGCLTDVALQRELLIHRFGFEPADILTLINQQATRAGIETAFREHLIQQAQPGDVVLVHFSGYGSLINLPEATVSPQLSLVPIDGLLAPTQPDAILLINDLVEETLYLLLRSLRTDQVTTVLDTSYYSLSDFNDTVMTADELPIWGVGTALTGNLRVRSRLSPLTGHLTPDALAAQASLRQQASNLKLKGQATYWQQFPGTLLTASPLLPAGTPLPAIGGNAFEVDWNGFSSGLLTASLVHHLWHLLPAATIVTSFAATRQAVQQVAGISQTPQLSGETRSVPYYVPNTIGAAASTLSGTYDANADAVVVAVEGDGKTGQIQLAGLPPLVLAQYGVHSQFTLLDPSLTQPLQVQVQSRNGLLARVRLLAAAPMANEGVVTSPDAGDRPAQEKRLPTLAVGQLLQESVRVVPRQMNLVVGLDSTLERIERVDATSAFSTLTMVSTVLADQPADYLFGRVSQLSPTLIAGLLPKKTTSPETPTTTSSSTTQVDTAPALEFLFDRASYGLMSIGRQVIPNTLVAGEEAVKVAVHRLAPQLQTLLAAKYLRSTSNPTSSQLGLCLTIAQVSPDRLVYQQSTERVPLPPDAPAIAGAMVTASTVSPDGPVLQVPVGSQVRYALYNYSSAPIYYLLLGLDTGGNAIALSGSLKTTPQDKRPRLQDQVIPPGAVITLPAIDAPTPWVVTGVKGQMELFLIGSHAPFPQAMTALGKGMPAIANGQRLAPLANPLEVAQAVLQDLQQAAVASGRVTSSNDTYSLDVRTWATFNVIYQVV